MDPELLRMMFGSLLMVPFYAVLAAAGFSISAAPVVGDITPLAVMFVPAVVGMFPNAVQQLLFTALSHFCDPQHFRIGASDR